MVLSFSSPAAVRFLAAVGQGHGLKGSARMAGIDKEVGYRFLRDRYLELRRGGMSAGDAVEALGFRSRWRRDVRFIGGSSGRVGGGSQVPM